MRQVVGGQEEADTSLDQRASSAPVPQHQHGEGSPTLERLGHRYSPLKQRLERGAREGWGEGLGVTRLLLASRDERPWVLGTERHERLVAFSETETGHSW